MGNYCLHSSVATNLIIITFNCIQFELNKLYIAAMLQDMTLAA